MKPEDIQRVKGLLPTDLGSDEIKTHYAKEILQRSIFSARMSVKRSTESILTPGVVQARLSLKSLSLGPLNANLHEFDESTRIFLRPTEPLFSLYLLDLGVDTQKAHARKTRPFQPARRYALRLGNLAVLERPLRRFQPRVKDIRLYGVATISNLIAVIDQLRSRRQRLANGDNVAETATLQRLGVARRLCSGVVKIGLNIKPDVVLTDLLPALHGCLSPEERLNPPRMAISNAAWNPQTQYGTGRGYYFHVFTRAAGVAYFPWCHNASMIPQTTVERQAVHGANLFLYGLHRLLKSMFALNPITKTVTGKIKNKPNNDDWNKLVAEGENKTPKMKQKLIEMKYRFHTESITRKAA